MNGSILGHTRIKVSWGHSASTPIHAQQRQQQQQQLALQQPIRHQQLLPPSMNRLGPPQQQFRPMQPPMYNPLKYMTSEESCERAFLEMERNLEMTELCREDEPRDINFAY